MGQEREDARLVKESVLLLELMAPIFLGEFAERRIFEYLF